MERSAIYTFMSGCRYGVVSSIARDGTPQAALVGIAVSPQFEIIFDTLNSSRKYRNLMERPECSFVVGWSGEHTVQYQGIAAAPAGGELKRYQETYFAAWPDGSARMNWAGNAYFVIRPRWIRYSDFDRRPPLIEEITFE